MGVWDRMRSVFGGDGEARRVLPREPVATMLRPTARMQEDWEAAARRDADEAADLTRPQIMREFGLERMPPLPGEPDRRRDALEALFLARTRDGFAAHLEEVERHYDLPDDRLLDMFPPPSEGVLAAPRDRADWISRSLIEDMLARTLEDRADRMEERATRIHGPGYSNGQIGNAPVVADPEMAEIASAVRSVADEWHSGGRAALRRGAFPIGERRADAVAVEAARRPGDIDHLEKALVRAFVEDMMDRLPMADRMWREEAREILAEDDAFLVARYGMAPRGGEDPERDVIALEILHLASMARPVPAASSGASGAQGGPAQEAERAAPRPASQAFRAQMAAAKSAEEKDPGITI